MPRRGACGVHASNVTGETNGAGARAIHAASTITAATAVAAARAALRQVFELAEGNAVVGLAGQRALECVAGAFFITQLQ